MLMLSGARPGLLRLRPVLVQGYKIDQWWPMKNYTFFSPKKEKNYTNIKSAKRLSFYTQLSLATVLSNSWPRSASGQTYKL